MQRKKWQNCCGSLSCPTNREVQNISSQFGSSCGTFFKFYSYLLCLGTRTRRGSRKASGLGMIWDRLWNWRTCGICKFHVKFVVNGMGLAEAFLNALDWLIKRKNCQWNPLDVVGCQFHKPFPMFCHRYHKWMGKTSINLSPDVGLSENRVNLPNEIAIFHRDNDQQNQWL